MAFSHHFDPTVLREYDIRGIVDKTLHTADAFAIGRCFGTMVARAGVARAGVARAGVANAGVAHDGDAHVGDAHVGVADAGVAQPGGPTVAVGYDGRLSSPDMEAALVEGLMASGMTVLRIGRGPTPMLYYTAATRRTGGAIMVTGSHNPPDYNGFKMILGGKPFFGPQIRVLGAMAAAGDVVPQAAGRPTAHPNRHPERHPAWSPTGPPAGRIETLDVAADYARRVLADYDGTRPLSVVWDNGNGAAGEVLTRLVSKLPGTHTILFPDIDGRFPNHHPDPTVPANLTQLIAEVRARGADLGIAFDGDADRIGLVDDTGEILFGDQLMVLLARDVLRTRPGATIIADVKASQVLFDEIARAGGTPLMWKTGHSLIKAKMAETGSPLAGEMSGHIFFADHWYGFDDALYAAVRTLGIVSRANMPLSTIRNALPHVVNTPELRFDCDDRHKFTVIEQVAARLRDAGANVTETDGVRVLTADGWWLLRASNTQAVLVARAEAADQAGLERLKAAIAYHLEASGLAPPDFDAPQAGH
jgi:phosphomannomutase